MLCVSSEMIKRLICLAAELSAESDISACHITGNSSRHIASCFVLQSWRKEDVQIQDWGCRQPQSWAPNRIPIPAVPSGPRKPPGEHHCQSQKSSSQDCAVTFQGTPQQPVLWCHECVQPAKVEPAATLVLVNILVQYCLHTLKLV